MSEASPADPPAFSDPERRHPASVARAAGRTFDVSGAGRAAGFRRPGPRLSGFILDSIAALGAAWRRLAMRRLDRTARRGRGAAEVDTGEGCARRLEALVQTLLGVVDFYDPYGAHHAARIGDLSRLIAEAMGLDGAVRETARISGTLIHLGGPLVPDATPAQASAVSGQDGLSLRDRLRATVALLDGLEFDGPVVATLRQLRRDVDGHGVPRGYPVEEVRISARIVRVADALVGMVSRRAGMPLDEALDALDRRADLYDRRVVAALRAHLDDEGGRAAWQAAPTVQGP
ncbi:MAG: HD-GYP domain-containing protein [Kiloniellaceae bacterium]